MPLEMIGGGEQAKEKGQGSQTNRKRILEVEVHLSVEMSTSLVSG